MFDNPVIKQLLDEYFRERRHAENLTTRIYNLECEATQQRQKIWELEQKLAAQSSTEEQDG